MEPSKTQLKNSNSQIIRCMLVITCIAFGVLIGWLGWWTVPIILLITLYLWSWRWALVVTLAITAVLMFSW